MAPFSTSDTVSELSGGTTQIPLQIWTLYPLTTETVLLIEQTTLERSRLGSLKKTKTQPT